MPGLSGVSVIPSLSGLAVLAGVSMTSMAAEQETYNDIMYYLSLKLSPLSVSQLSLRLNCIHSNDMCLCVGIENALQEMLLPLHLLQRLSDRLALSVTDKRL